MLDIKLIADSPQAVKDALNNRCDPALIDEVVTLNNRRKEILGQVESMKATRNSVSGRIATLKREKKPCDDLIAEMKDLGDNIKIFDDEMQSLEPVLRECLLKIPNIPDATVPSGKDESDNQEVRRFSAPRMFDFQPKPHWEIGESLGILDAAAAGKITGARFTVYRGDGARLERAVINFMLNCHGERGYTEILPPFLVNRDSMYGTGQLPKFEEDAFSVAGTSYFLVPTAEVPVTNLYRGDTLGVDALPIRMCAYTACFRAEAGSAGRDTRGLIRQHQFNKVELVKLCHPEKSDGELEGLTGDAEAILQQLGLPYRVEVLCSGDTGFGSAKTYDLEVWMPSYNKYVEISSCSNYKDFQARRMNIKYKDGSQSGFVHTLNGSGLAVGRTVAAILENYQNADGSVTIPDALVPFFGKKFIGKDC